MLRCTTSGKNVNDCVALFLAILRLKSCVHTILIYGNKFKHQPSFKTMTGEKQSPSCASYVIITSISTTFTFILKTKKGHTYKQILIIDIFHN